VIPPAIIIFILLFLVGLGFNLIGAKGINLFFSLVLVLITLACSLRAEAIINIFFAGVISGIIQTPQTMPKEIKKFFTWYIGLVGQIMLWTSIVFFFLGTIDASGHTRALLGLLAAIILIQLIQAMWKIGKTWGKKFVYYYVSVMLLVFAFSLIPDTFVNCDFCKEIRGFAKTQWAKLFQSSTAYQLPADIKIYAYTDKVMVLSSLKYTKPVEAVSLNETVKQNGAVYEKVGLPDPTTDQPGSIVGWVFIGDLKKEISIQTQAPASSPAPTVLAPASPITNSVAPQGIAQPIIVKIKKDGATPYWKELPAGEYTLEPRRAQFVRDGENFISDSNGSLSLSKKMLVNFYLPGAEIGTVTITPK